MLGRALQSMNGREIADGSAVVVEHGLDHALREQIGRSEIHLKQSVEMLRLHFEKGAIEGDAGVVDEDTMSSQSFRVIA
jgi:hypothetical protein